QHERAPFDVARVLAARVLEHLFRLAPSGRHVRETPRCLCCEVPPPDRRFELDRTLEPGARDREGGAAQRPPACALERCRSLVREIDWNCALELCSERRRPLEMVRVDVGELVRRALFDPLRHAPMVLRTFGLADRRVRDLPDQAVGELEGTLPRDGRVGFRCDELALEQPVEARSDVDSRRERVERAAPEDAADERSALQEPLVGARGLPPPHVGRNSSRLGRATHTSKTGALRSVRARCSITLSSASSAQWTSSKTSTRGCASASRSAQIVTAHVSSATLWPSSAAPRTPSATA